MINELTCGRLGKFLWFNWCFYISLDDHVLIVKVPFYRKTIPRERIKKLESAKRILQPKHLKLTYEDGNQAIKFIEFFSVNPVVWFDELQKRGVEIEDDEGLKSVKNDQCLQFAKKFNLGAGTAAMVVAVAAVIVVVIGLVAGWF